MRDDFPIRIKRTVAERVGFLCSRPSCRAPTSGPQHTPGSSVNVGVAAHISAASPGGPRFDETMTSEERGSEFNAIWLCQNCAKLVDNDVERFPVSVLRKWKINAEQEARKSVGKPQKGGIQERAFLDERFKMVIEDYKRCGTPQNMIDTFDDLSMGQKAQLFERAIKWEHKRLPKNNPYRDNE